MSADRVLKTGVFVSHASADDKLVSRIHDRLTAAGIDAWVDHEDRIGSSADWVNQIQAALNDYEAGLAVLSRDFIESFACRNECWTLLNLKKPLHVALIEPIPRDKFPWWLNTTEHLDFSADFDGSLTRLINAITGAPVSKTSAPVRTLITGTIDRRLTQIPISGRDADLAHIKSLITRGPASILGVGGVGKSRLAAEIVLTAEGISGVIWHVCTDLSRAEDVLIQLRDHLGLELTTSRHDILARLRAEKLLIVLDNGESVSDDRRPDYVTLINDLCHAGARLLITSRVEWEEIELGRTHTPHPLDPDPARQVVLDMAAAWELENNLTPHADTIAQAARRHPRLIEWAVRQMKRFSPEKVIGDLQELKSERLQDALDEMIRKTLRQMTETAGPEPEAALRRLAVCRGGFSYEAARANLGLKNDTNTLDDCLITLQTWQFVANTVLPDGRTRYAVDPMALAAVREDDSAFRPHYDYYYALARLHRERQDYLGLDVESENLEAAFEWAMAAGETEAAYWLANACHNFLANRGRFDLRLYWFERVAALVDHSNRKLWANVQNDLGIVYRSHPTGDRRVNLQRAVVAYEAALTYYTPETAPLDYAATQNNLGIAYWSLSQVEDRAGNLKRGVAAYEEALKYCTPETAPLNYATTQNSLGIVYQELSLVEDRAGNLTRAVVAYEEALKYLTPETATLDYAMTQNNLGTAYNDLSEVEDRAENLSRAVAAFEEALKYWTPETAPLDYAMTQNNLGLAYQNLSEVEDREENLSRAVVAYETALKYRTPERAPLGYARTQANLGIAQESLGDLPAAVACWREAERYFRLMGMEEYAQRVRPWIEEAEGGAGE